MAPFLTRTSVFLSLSKRNRERKSENANQGCLENHEIRVACLEKRVRGHVRMTAITHTSPKLRSTYVRHVCDLSKPERWRKLID